MDFEFREIDIRDRRPFINLGDLESYFYTTVVQNILNPGSTLYISYKEGDWRSQIDLSYNSPIGDPGRQAKWMIAKFFDELGTILAMDRQKAVESFKELQGVIPVSVFHIAAIMTNNNALELLCELY